MDHTWYKCTKDCNGCCYCCGGLATYTVCGGSEVQLPRDCPGKEMTEDQKRKVSNGTLGYSKEDGWIGLVVAPLGQGPEDEASYSAHIKWSEENTRDYS